MQTPIKKFPPDTLEPIPERNGKMVEDALADSGIVKRSRFLRWNIDYGVDQSRGDRPP